MANGDQVLVPIGQMAEKVVGDATDEVVVQPNGNDSVAPEKMTLATVKRFAQAGEASGVQPTNAPSLNDVIRYDGANPLWGKIGSGGDCSAWSGRVGSVCGWCHRVERVGAVGSGSVAEHAGGW